MRRTILGLMAAAGLIASGSTASAQPNRNVINNSGNGINNTIIAQNHHHGVPLYAPGYGGGYSSNTINNSGNGIGNTIITKNVTGFPSYGGGYAPGYVTGYTPGYGGSFNPFPGGVNVNVVTNSGNGIGNTVVAGNGQPGGLNINVITNSGNGQGNTIVTRNR